MIKKNAYIIWSNAIQDWATETKYPESMDFNTWAHGFLAGAKELHIDGPVVVNVASKEEVDSGCSTVSASERKAIAAI